MATTPQQLRAFLDRPWAKLRAAKDRHTAAVIARDGTDRAFQLAAVLRDHAVAMGARPTAADRRADLDAAVALRRKLDRAGRRPAALADLAAAFAGLGVRWYVFGAQAVIAAGVPRLTADIDVTVESPRGGSRALVAALAHHGIAMRDVGDVATFIAETRVIPAIHVASQLPIDVVLAGPGLEEDMMTRVQRRSVGATEVPFVDTADLIALKILAGRDKDLEDVRALGRAELPGLSLELARRRVAKLGALIDDSTLVQTFDRLMKPSPPVRTKAAKRPRAPARKKRYLSRCRRGRSRSWR